MRGDLHRAGVGPQGSPGQSGMQVPYRKPFVRSLDVDDTEGKPHLSVEADSFGLHGGPS